MMMIISFRHPCILFGHLVLLLLLVQHGHCASQGGEPRPMVCNNDTNFQCVCGTEPPISDAPMLCEYFIQSRELPVVDMRARHVNLEASLHTNENYETYFKRRIAQIVSSYCERQVNECPGVTLHITKEADARVADDKTVLYATDENEPPLTQDNVVLLRVEKEPGNITRMLFVITRSDMVGSLAESQIIDPVKVKVILGSQAVPLSRILGGIKLESVRVSRIRRALKPEDTDNSKLHYMIGIVALFFLICYIIGGFKIYRDCKRKKKEQLEQQHNEEAALTTVVPNYGTLNNHDDKPTTNGSALAGRTEEPLINHYQQIDETDHNNEPHVLSDREAKFMFMCDPSQLPREMTFDSQTDLLADNSKATPPREEKIEEVSEEPKEEVEEEEQLQRTSPVAEPVVPDVILVPSMSIQAETPQDFDSTLSPDITDPAVAFLGRDSPPEPRPLSRRGSRADEEEIDLTELGVGEQPMFTDLVIPPEIEERPVSTENWSSSDGEAELYYKMSDDEDIKGDKWIDNKAEEPVESEDEATEPVHEEENIVYERLKEDAASPLPPHD